MIKLKDLLKESSPGFTNRKFGDPLPTFKDVMKKHKQVKEASGKDDAEWTRDELALLKKIRVKVDGKQHKFKIEKSGRDKNRKAKFDTKDTWGTIEKWLIRGKTSYSGWFSAWEGGGMGWKGSEIKSSRDFDEEQNLKLLVSMFKKLQTKINRVWN
jgi:hypothetical protein